LQAPAASQVPLALQTPERQTVAPVELVQGPSPFAYPHALPLSSQTPLWHTRAPAAAEQVPFSVGFVCGPSVGIAVPFASVAVQVCIDSSHHCSAAQSASTSQLPAAMHVPFALQTPERQTVAPVELVHGPSPSS
jgi:hypothetical protein